MRALFRRVLVPHDFSAHATRALRVGAELAAGAKGRLVVLHAVPIVYPIVAAAEPIGWYPPPIATPELIATERRRLEAVVRRELRGRKLRIECRVVAGDAFQSIVDAARGATVIVMGTLGRSGLPHLLLGSVAEKVVRHAPVPVLTIRPRALARRSPGKHRR